MYNALPTRKIKYLHFWFGLSWHSAFLRKMSKNYYQEPLFRTALRAEVTAERTRQHRRTMRTSATLRRGRGSPGQPASCAVSSENETPWGGGGGSKLPLIYLKRSLCHLHNADLLRENSKYFHYKSCLWKVHFASFRLLHWYCTA